MLDLMIGLSLPCYLTCLAKLVSLLLSLLRTLPTLSKQTKLDKKLTILLHPFSFEKGKKTFKKKKYFNFLSRLGAHQPHFFLHWLRHASASAAFNVTKHDLKRYIFIFSTIRS